MRKKKKRGKSRKWPWLAGGISLLVIISAVLAIFLLDQEVRGRFDGKRWSLPAIVYARPLELYPGLQLSPEALEEELQLAGYRSETQVRGTGSYTRKDSTIRLITRDFYYPSGYEPAKSLVLTFRAGRVESLTASGETAPLSLVRLDPARIGSFHPTAHEDRILLTREEIPKQLLDTLLAVEDRTFFTHLGISPMAMVRALVANLKAGRTVQGGSTLTQQLVKNLFLSRERTILRKIEEAAMALLLELHYSKDEILTAYCNEVFLGQDNNRAIHGFTLAAQFYFRRSLADLRPEQIATLVGMIKGPSTYDPRRNSENSLARRNVVLAVMAAQGVIDAGTLQEATARPLTEFVPQKGGFNRFPAFLDLVRQQLAGEYSEADLKENGLQILTTLDPQIQYQVEKKLQDTIVTLNGKQKGQSLEGAVVLTSRETGEVLAMAGGKKTLDGDFNRALKTRRPIGSLVKPAVYLTALAGGYTLASPLLDAAITVQTGTHDHWSPANYDKKEHGRVALFTALANSLNLATVRLGQEVGLETVMATIRKLGYGGELQPYPSLLLGSVNMTPFEVSQMYQTISSGGFFTSLKAINSVMAADHTLLKRYGIAVEQRFEPAIIFLLSHAMQRVLSEGTGTALLRSALHDHKVAGKTGTSDDLRDSWFAGFTGDHLAVVWLGRDDNSSANLTGSAGGMKVWLEIMAAISSRPLTLVEPAGIVWADVDRGTLERTREAGGKSTRLPFLASSVPSGLAAPSLESGKMEMKEPGLLEKLKSWFN